MAKDGMIKYPVMFTPKEHADLKEAAQIDGRTMIKFMKIAIQEKVDQIQMNSITRPWIPSGLKRVT